MPGVIVDYGSDGIATITFDRPATLNSITAEDYNDFANALRDIDARPDILATIWRATGNFFCSGTDLSEAVKKMAIEGVRARHVFGPSVYPTNTDTSQALYSHSKILIAALNGPVLGIAAPFVSHCDLIYCVPSTYLTVPFVSLGLISEAGSSVSFANRMGLARANEVLLAGKKLSAEELLQCNFVNEIIPAQSTDAFHAIVRERVQTMVQTADPVALLATKRLIRTGVMEKNDPDGVNMRESLEQSKRLGSGVPGRRFKVLAAEVGHKSKL